MMDNILLYDSLLKEYISYVVSYKGVRIANVSTLPTGLTYQLDGLTYKFNIGDIVRIPSLDNLSGYAFYRLDNIDNNQPVWSELAEGDLRLPETITVHIASNQASTTDLLGLTVTVGGTTKTYQGQDLIFLVDQDVQYTITASDVAGYQKVNNSTSTYTALLLGSREATITYNTEVVSVTVTKLNAGTVSNPTLTLSIDGVAISNPTFPYKVAYGSEYTVGVSDSISGYKAPSAVTRTALAVSYDINLQYAELPVGIWAYYEDGTLKSYADATTSAIGVAIITADHSFVMAKDRITMQKFGGHSKDLSNVGIVCTSNSSLAKLDLDGEKNTTILINLLSGYTDAANTVGAPAAQSCRYLFGGKGYLGSVGEWDIIFNNLSTVLNMLTKIGSSDGMMGSGAVMTSTLYDGLYLYWAYYITESPLGPRSRYRQYGTGLYAFMSI